MSVVRILLTGGSGFVGSRLAAILVARGIEVFNAGRRPCIVPGVTNIEVSALEHLSAAMPSASRFDGVIHLAAAGVNPGNRDREEIRRINAMLAPQMVALAASVGARAVIVAGSSAEYRAPDSLSPVTEQMLLETQKIYGASKAAGGILALAEGAALPLPVAVARLFNVYGPGEAAHRLLPSLAHALTAGQPVKLSPGTQIRDFVHVDDVCEGLFAALTALSDGSMQSGAYNLSSGNGISVGDFARAVAAELHADPALLRFGTIPFRPDDLPYVVGDSSKLRNACGWTPHISLEAGIARTLAER